MLPPKPLTVHPTRLPNLLRNYGIPRLLARWAQDIGTVRPVNSWAARLEKDQMSFSDEKSDCCSRHRLNLATAKK